MAILNQVVPSRRLAVVAVEGPHVRVQVICAAAPEPARERAIRVQVGRVCAKPLLGLLGVDRSLHCFAHFVGGEQEVVLDLLFRQADIGQTVVPHEGGRVAVQAIVDESSRRSGD